MMSAGLPLSCACAVKISRSFATMSGATSAPATTSGLLAVTCIATIATRVRRRRRSTRRARLCDCRRADSSRPARRALRASAIRRTDDVLTDLLHQRFALRLEAAGEQRRDIGAALLECDVAHARDEREELLVARGEVGLDVDFDQHGVAAIVGDAQRPSRPSEAVRSAFFAALSALLRRRLSIAASMSPSASVSAFLQSIMPSPVSSRSSLTIAAVDVAISEALVHVVSAVSVADVVDLDELVDADFTAGARLTFGDRVGNRGHVQTHRADRIVVAGNDVVDADRIAVGIDDADHRECRACSLPIRRCVRAARRRRTAHRADRPCS